jgi:hypothetical protein
MLLVAMARDLSVIEIPIRLRRRIGDSKGASQSLWKGLWVGLAMIWHIMTFRLAPRVGDPVNANGHPQANDESDQLSSPGSQVTSRS